MKLLLLGVFLFSMLFSESKNGGKVQLHIKNATSDKGLVRILIFNKKGGFPEKHENAFKALSLPISNSVTKVTIKDLPDGDYAFAVFHDEDSDGKMKKNNLGIPIDSYGFSNNPTLLLGPPNFSKCAVSVKNALVKVEISLR